jgi:hypothetical protein
MTTTGCCSYLVLARPPEPYTRQTFITKSTLRQSSWRNTRAHCNLQLILIGAIAIVFMRLSLAFGLDRSSSSLSSLPLFLP